MFLLSILCTIPAQRDKHGKSPLAAATEGGFEDTVGRVLAGQAAGQAPPPRPPKNQSRSKTLLPEPDHDWVRAEDGGETYFYNAVTRESRWEKPEVMKTPGERLLEQSPWRECQDAGGAAFYYNSETQESEWMVPAELQAVRDVLAAEMDQ